MVFEEVSAYPRAGSTSFASRRERIPLDYTGQITTQGSRTASALVSAASSEIAATAAACRLRST